MIVCSYSERDLNPHRHYCPLDFKSSVSTDSTIRASSLYVSNKKRAKNGVRTRDLNLGKVALYQLSYFRLCISVSLQLICFSFAVQRYNKFQYLQIFSYFFYNFFCFKKLTYILSGTCIPNILNEAAIISPIFSHKTTLKCNIKSFFSPRMGTFW